jgi:SAM-dependent methyltransferase
VEPYALTDLAEFLGVEPDAIKPYLVDSERVTKLLWNDMVGEHEPEKRYDPVAVERYYRHPVVQAAYLVALTEFWARPERQMALAFYVAQLRERILPNAYVVDYGAGTGEVLLAVAERHKDANFVAVDYPGLRKQYLAWRAQNKVNAAHIVQFDFEQFWDAAGPGWDAVICTSTLEHVADIEGMTRKLVSLIKPGGCALFEVDWVYNRDFPMHLPVTASWRETWATELMPSLGMYRIEGALWQKDVAYAN